MGRIIVALTVLVAIIEGVGNLETGGILALALVVLGIVYAITEVDAEDATGELAVVIASGAAVSSGALGGLDVIAGIGGHLNAILGQIVVALYAGAATVLVVRIVNRLKG
jgi:hypothetical protein